MPKVVAVGEPDLGYPERWSVVRWLEGNNPTVADPASHAGPTRRALARDLAAVVTALRDIQVAHSALADPQLRWYRGAPIGTMDDTTRHNVTGLYELLGFKVVAQELLDDATWKESRTGKQKLKRPLLPGLI